MEEQPFKVSLKCRLKGVWGKGKKKIKEASSPVRINSRKRNWASDCFGPVYPPQVAVCCFGKLETGTKTLQTTKNPTRFLGCRLPLKCPSNLFLYCGSDVAEHFAYGLKQWVAECVDADRIDAANALDLNQVAPYAWHHRPDVQEWQNGKVDAPDESHRNAKDCWEQTIKPVFCYSEGGKTGLPNPIKAVCSLWLSNHIFKINLQQRTQSQVSQAFASGVDYRNTLPGVQWCPAREKNEVHTSYTPTWFNPF